MMRIFFLMTFLWLNSGLFAQNGIKFEELSIEEALVKAKINNKLIFVDCYKSGCCPCKQMENEIFILESIGKYFDKNFISLKLKMEKGPEREIGLQYGVACFPTYLILDTEGKMIHKFAGYFPEKEFIAELEKRNDPQNSFSALERRYQNGERGKIFLHQYMTALNSMAIQKNVATIATELADLLTDEEKVKKENWMLFSNSAAPRGSANARYLFDNYTRFCKTIGEDILRSTVSWRYVPILSGVLSGHFQPGIDQNELKKMEKEIEPLPVELKRYIQIYITLAGKMLQNDFAGIIEICNRDLASLKEREMVNLYTSGLLLNIMKSATPVQQKQWLELGKRLTKDVKNEMNRSKMKSNIENAEKRMYINDKA